MAFKRTVKLVRQMHMGMYIQFHCVEQCCTAHVWPVCGCSINIETFIWQKRTAQSNQEDRLSLESVLSPWRQQHKRGCYSDSRTIHPTPSINTLISQKSPFSQRLISSHCSRETYRRSFVSTVIRLLPHLSRIKTFPLIFPL